MRKALHNSCHFSFSELEDALHPVGGFVLFVIVILGLFIRSALYPGRDLEDLGLFDPLAVKNSARRQMKQQQQ